MLYIYNYMVDWIEDHLKKRNIKAEVRFNIGKNWHKYRYIQIIPDGLDSNIHYEYKNHHWELHFEDTENNEKAENLRKKMIKSFNTTDFIRWHNWFWHQRGLLRLEKEVFDDSYESLFDELWDATIHILINNYYDSNNIEPNITPKKSPDISYNIQEYHEPDKPQIVQVASMEYDRFTIPSYQRPYKWGVKNVNQLIDDIITFCEQGTKEYRLGTLVLHKLSNDPYSEMEIVDGQQRSITLLLLLNELRNKTEFSDLFLPDFCKSMDSFLEKPQFHDAITRQHIQENINVIRFRIVEMKKEHVRFLLYGCCFVVISLYDISEAFQFFDSQNARGKELEPHDLLKAYHLREILQLSDEDFNNISSWEQMDTPILTPLFLILFRIKRWVESKNGQFFTTNQIDTFKGYSTNKSQLPYQKIFLMADCYAHIYNNDISRRLDKQHMDYPHQIDQATINGSLFFDMIRYYAEKCQILPSLLNNYASSIADALENYNERNRSGDKYIRAMFDAALLFYYDKFGTEGIENAIRKIFLWSYTKRLTQISVKRATMDNYAREANSAFHIIHSATKPSDILNWKLDIIKMRDIKQNGMNQIKVIFNNFNQIEKQ